MDLTKEKIYQIIEEELAAVSETYRARGESGEEHAARKSKAASTGANKLGTMGTSRSAGKTPEEKAAAELTSKALVFLRLMKMGKKNLPPMSDEVAAEVERLTNMSINLEEEK